jgi:hypothetical protein
MHAHAVLEHVIEEQHDHPLAHEAAHPVGKHGEHGVDPPERMSALRAGMARSGTDGLLSWKGVDRRRG